MTPRAPNSATERSHDLINAAKTQKRTPCKAPFPPTVTREYPLQEHTAHLINSIEMIISENVCQPTINNTLTIRWVFDEMKPEIETVIGIDESMARFVGKLITANYLGVRKSELELAALAKMERLGIEYDLAAHPRMDTGKKKCWVRLKGVAEDH